jgi:hypothetical protein
MFYDHILTVYSVFKLQWLVIRLFYDDLSDTLYSFECVM